MRGFRKRFALTVFALGQADMNKRRTTLQQ